VLAGAAEQGTVELKKKGLYFVTLIAANTCTGTVSPVEIQHKPTEATARCQQRDER